MVQKMMVENHSLIIGLGFLNLVFNFRILSAACPNMESFKKGYLLGGFPGDSTFTANPVLIYEENLFGNILCQVASSAVGMEY